MYKLFGADGIRGPIDQFPLRPDDLERLGLCLGAFFRISEIHPIIIVATDTRESLGRTKSTLVNGLIHAGAEVFDAGILPTAAISYLISRKGYFSGGVMVSASHITVSENGIKIFGHTGLKLSDQDESVIEELFFSASPLPYEVSPASICADPALIADYADALVDEFSSIINYPKYVLADFANGSLSFIGPQILERLHVRYTLLNASPNGLNINARGGSELLRSAPDQFLTALRDYDSHIGIAVDGDADRVLFIDKEGKVYDGDSMLAIFGLSLQQENNLWESTVVGTQLNNKGLEHYLGQQNIQLLRVENGDKYISQELVRRQLILGGESIGHIILHSDNLHLTGDGLRTSLALLSLLSKAKDIRLVDLAPGFRKWPQVKGTVSLSRRITTKADEIDGLPELLDSIMKQLPAPFRVICRPASTEAAYRIMLECRDINPLILARYAYRLACFIQVRLECEGFPIQILDCVNGGQFSINQLMFDSFN